MSDPLIVFDQIESYLLGEMTPEAQAAFEADLGRDERLREETERYRTILAGIEEAGARAALQAVMAESTPVVSWKSHQRRLVPVLAAAVALILLAVWLWPGGQNTSESLFAAYHTPYPGLPTPLGLANNIPFARGMIAYKRGEYAEARRWWREVTGPGQNDTVLFYTGAAWLADGQPDSALALLKSVTRSEAFAAEAQWRICLAHVRSGAWADAVAALDTLENTFPAYSQPAQNLRADILRQLKP